MNRFHERRVAFRMDVLSKAICRLTSEAETISGPIKDISIAGLYLQTTDKPAVDSRFDVEIILTGKHSEMVLGSMTAVIARHDDNGLAIRFDERFEWFAMVPLYFHTTSNFP